jgi:cell division protein FtsB
MKINLRKASVVQQTIIDEIKRLGNEKTTVSVSLFADNVANLLNTQLEKVIANNQRVGRLLDANRYLRATVAKKNAEVGITDYLAEDAFLASAESRVRQITELEVRPDLTALEKEIQARSANTGNERSIYGRDYNIEVNVALPETVAEAKAELARIQRRRRKIKDEMVTINVRTEFEVAEQVALVLTDLGLD